MSDECSGCGGSFPLGSHMMGICDCSRGYCQDTAKVHDCETQCMVCPSCYAPECARKTNYSGHQNLEVRGAEDFNRKAVSIIDYPDSGERVTYQLSCGHNITVENDWFSGDAKEGLGEEWECFECMDSFGADFVPLNQEYWCSWCGDNEKSSLPQNCINYHYHYQPDNPSCNNKMCLTCYNQHQGRCYPCEENEQAAESFGADWEVSVDKLTHQKQDFKVKGKDYPSQAERKALSLAKKKKSGWKDYPEGAGFAEAKYDARHARRTGWDAESFGAEYDVMCGSCGDYEAVVNCDNPSCQMQLCSSCRRQHKKGNHWITIIDEENDVAFEGCDGCHREVGYVWDNTPIGKTEAGIPMQRGGWIRDAESFGAESQIGPTDECKVFLYEAYRDTIHTFNGCFETLDEAETYIYNTWMQDAKATLKELRTKKEQGRMGISDWMQTIIDDKEKMLGYMSVEAYEDMLAEQVKNRPERAKQDEEGLKYYEDNMDRWEKEWKILSQTPQATIQESNSKLYPAYSQRYQNGSGNYPYIIFDPSFIPDTQGAESFGAEGHGPYAGNYRAHVMEYLLGETSDDEIMDVFDISQEDLDTYWEAESFGAEYGKRQRFGNRYVGRDTKGKFISNVSVGRSLKADRRNKSKTPARSGFGNMGDIQKGVSGFTLPSDTKRMIGMGAVLGGILAYWESKA